VQHELRENTRLRWSKARYGAARSVGLAIELDTLKRWWTLPEKGNDTLKRWETQPEARQRALVLVMVVMLYTNPQA